MGWVWAYIFASCHACCLIIAFNGPRRALRSPRWGNGKQAALSFVCNTYAAPRSLLPLSLGVIGRLRSLIVDIFITIWFKSFRTNMVGR